MKTRIKELIIDLIKKDPKITIGELSELLNISSIEVLDFIKSIENAQLNIEFENLRQLTETEKQILTILKERGKVGLHELSSQLGISIKDVNRVTMALTRKGYQLAHENVASGIINAWITS